MSKIIMHIDLNAFYATAEQIKNPEYQGKPVIVGGLGLRGVVSTCSYEARAFGVHSAMPIGEARRLCPQGIYLFPDFEYYELLSRSFFGYLRNYSSIIEEASIDEGFVDMTKYLQKEKDPMKCLKELQEGLYKELGLKCSIGVAPTKFLAKMGSDMKKPMGITVIRRRDIKKMLYPLKIADFFGVGKKSAAYLDTLGVKTIGDFVTILETKEDEMRKHFGKSYDWYLNNIHGKGDDVVITEYPDQKSLGHSQTFLFDTNDPDEIREMLNNLCGRVARGIAREKKKARSITVNIKDEHFKSFSKVVSLDEPIFEEEDIIKVANRIYNNTFLGIVIRLIGVTAGNLVPLKEKNVQMSLWNYESYEKEDETKLLVNSLNRKANKKLLVMASEVKKNGNK